MAEKKVSNKRKKQDQRSAGLKRFCIVKPSKIHGMGVFATKTIKEGNTVEQCCTLKFPWKDAKGNILGKYVFDYHNKTVALILGNGSIYNHSVDPNVDHVWLDDDQKFVEFYATKDIRKGQELFINYGEEYWENNKELKV